MSLLTSATRDGEILLLNCLSSIIENTNKNSSEYDCFGTQYVIVENSPVSIKEIVTSVLDFAEKHQNRLYPDELKTQNNLIEKLKTIFTNEVPKEVYAQADRCTQVSMTIADYLSRATTFGETTYEKLNTFDTANYSAPASKRHTE
ncbi:MAG: hypothetical protein V4487_06595 [Chlamydiota bacterium]